MDTPINPVDTLLPIIATAVEQWKQSLNEEKLTKQVKDRLDKAAEQVLLKLLGFDMRYDDKWELDHCNGRAGESAAGKYLKEVQSAAIKEWLAKIPLPVLSPKLLRSLAQTSKSAYADQLQREVYSRAMARAAADGEALVNKIVASNQLQDYLKLLAVVNPPPKTENT